VEYSATEQYQGLQSGDTRVLDYLYRTNFKTVRKYVLANKGSEDDARDIFQESLMATWMNIHNGKYQLDPASEPGAYVFRVAKYKWLDRLKSKHFSSRSSVSIDSLHVVDSISSDELHDAEQNLAYLSELFGSLGDKCQHILRLFYYDKMSMDDIGKQLGHDSESLRTMKYRCMMSLRKKHLELTPAQ